MPEIPNSTDHAISNAPIESWKSNPRLVSGRANKAAGTIILQSHEQGIPRPVSNVATSTNRKVYGGATYTQVNLSHNTDSNDQTFHHANIWITGLGGSQTPQLHSGSTSSPHTLTLPATGEKVSLTVQSVGKDGSLLPLSQSPSTTVQL